MAAAIKAPEAPGVPTIQQALSAVMGKVRAVGKAQRNADQNYRFRGIDDVINAVGPALREFNVLVLPTVLDVTYRDVRTSRDKPAREVTVRVRYTFVGPASDSIEIEVPGESMDSGDKGTAKAMSVAYRIALLQALCLPTDEADPDAHTYERAYAQQPAKESRSDERAPAASPADEARNDLLELCRSNGWNTKQVAAAYVAATGMHLPAEPDAEAVRSFMRDLEAAPEQILALAGGVPA